MNKRNTLMILGIIWAIVSVIFLIEFIANTAYNYIYNIAELNENIALNIFQTCVGSIFYIGNVIISILIAVFCYKSKKNSN